MRIYWIFGLFFLFLTSTSHAHELGVKPYIAANGIYLEHYPILGASTPDFIMPHYIIEKKILVQDQIVFLLETEKLPLPSQTTERAVITWDFGDGTQRTGAEVVHEYSQAGSYIITLSVAQNPEQPVFAERIIVHVLPDMSYILPKTNISINGTSHDGGESPVRIDLSESVLFAAEITKGSADIVSYYWDLGDKTTSNAQSLSHTYASFHAAAKPLLRVRDENGFIADTSVTLENSELVDTHRNPVAKTQNSTILLLLLFLVVSVGLLAAKNRYKNTKK